LINRQFRRRAHALEQLRIAIFLADDRSGYADPSVGQGESDGRTDPRSASSDDGRSALEHAHLPSRGMLAIVGAVDKFCVPLNPLATQMDVGLRAGNPGGFVWLQVTPQSIFC
jgi:hypothetical protein